MITFELHLDDILDPVLTEAGAAAVSQGEIEATSGTVREIFSILSGGAECIAALRITRAAASPPTVDDLRRREAAAVDEVVRSFSAVVMASKETADAPIYVDENHLNGASLQIAFLALEVFRAAGWRAHEAAKSTGLFRQWLLTPPQSPT